MGLRQWFSEIMSDDDSKRQDRPPGKSLVGTLLGRDAERVRSLGEYNAENYPAELRERLSRRQEVAEEFLKLNVTAKAGRAEAIPRLRELLRQYPHPLVYETLIHAYIDAGRYDEAKGVAFAARQRRNECASSEYPEIRSEIDAIREWSAEEIDDLSRQD